MGEKCEAAEQWNHGNIDFCESQRFNLFFFVVVVVIIKTFLASIPVLNHLETEEKGRISDTNPLFI